MARVAARQKHQWSASVPWIHWIGCQCKGVCWRNMLTQQMTGGRPRRTCDDHDCRDKQSDCRPHNLAVCPKGKHTTLGAWPVKTSCLPTVVVQLLACVPIAAVCTCPFGLVSPSSSAFAVEAVIIGTFAVPQKCQLLHAQCVTSATQWVQAVVTLGLPSIEVHKKWSSNASKPHTNSVIGSGIFHSLCLESQSPLLEWDCCIHVHSTVVVGLSQRLLCCICFVVVGCVGWFFVEWLVVVCIIICLVCTVLMSCSLAVDAICCLCLVPSCVLLFLHLILAVEAVVSHSFNGMECIFFWQQGFHLFCAGQFNDLCQQTGVFLAKLPVRCVIPWSNLQTMRATVILLDLSSHSHGASSPSHLPLQWISNGHCSQEILWLPKNSTNDGVNTQWNLCDRNCELIQCANTKWMTAVLIFSLQCLLQFRSDILCLCKSMMNQWHFVTLVKFKLHHLSFSMMWQNGFSILCGSLQACHAHAVAKQKQFFATHSAEILLSNDQKSKTNLIFMRHFNLFWLCIKSDTFAFGIDWHCFGCSALFWLMPMHMPLFFAMFGRNSAVHLVSASDFWFPCCTVFCHWLRPCFCMCSELITTLCTICHIAFLSEMWLICFCVECCILQLSQNSKFWQSTQKWVNLPFSSGGFKMLSINNEAHFAVFIIWLTVFAWLSHHFECEWTFLKYHTLLHFLMQSKIKIYGTASRHHIKSAGWLVLCHFSNHPAENFAHSILNEAIFVEFIGWWVGHSHQLKIGRNVGVELVGEWCHIPLSPSCCWWRTTRCFHEDQLATDVTKSDRNIDKEERTKKTITFCV